MSGYQPRHAASVTDEVGPERPNKPTRGTLGLAASAMAVLAVVAVLLVASLPHSSHPASAGGPRPSTPLARAKTHRPAPPATTGPARGGKAGHNRARPAGRALAAGHRPAASTTRPARAGSTTRPSRGPGAAHLKPSALSTAPARPPSTTPTTSAGATSSPAVNLPAPAGFGPLLREVWVSADPWGAGITAQDVQSTLPGSVYYAEQPAIGNYWAISAFVPTAQAQALASSPAGEALLEKFRYVSVFNKAPGRGWAYLGSFPPGSCPTVVPEPVYAAWGLCQVGS